MEEVGVRGADAAQEGLEEGCREVGSLVFIPA